MLILITENIFLKEKMMKKTKSLTSRQKKTERQNTRRKAKRNTIRMNHSKGKNIAFQIFQTIIHFFPNLFDKMQELEDCRKK